MCAKWAETETGNSINILSRAYLTPPPLPLHCHLHAVRVRPPLFRFCQCNFIKHRRKGHAEIDVAIFVTTIVLST